ncbi:hypothetical protein F2Q69_00033409 [Brassica cretica]|uniref:Oberon coiled-coil region domain-containing protein n=1 Tax=Brassica cretica TaxID=69181 RepID=A0A8S9SRL8_BRACR|nr:hypothetical protein F2Q69_00033409 [Brassica cretica]
MLLNVCNGPSQMLDWVEEVFQPCAPNWDRNSLIEDSTLFVGYYAKIQELSIVDRELEAKAKEVAKLQAERQKKKLQRDELERIVRLKQAEADMLQLKTLFSIFIGPEVIWKKVMIFQHFGDKVRKHQS